jgi:hypothetical protein
MPFRRPDDAIPVSICDPLHAQIAASSNSEDTSPTRTCPARAIQLTKPTARRRDRFERNDVGRRSGKVSAWCGSPAWRSDPRWKLSIRVGACAAIPILADATLIVT